MINISRGGGGTIASVSVGNLSPLFASSVATPSTTPAIIFSLSNASANSVLGQRVGGMAAPTYMPVPACGGATHALGWSSGPGFICQAITGTGTGGGGGSVTGSLTAFHSGEIGWAGTTNIAVSGTANAIVASHFRYSKRVTTYFSGIWLVFTTADAAATAAAAVYDITDNSMLCHSTPLTPTLSGEEFPCVEGTVTLPPNHDYIFLTASSGTTATTLRSAVNQVASRYSNANATQCTYSPTTGTSCAGSPTFTLGNYAINGLSTGGSPAVHIGLYCKQ
jgi:hypothetical protein